MNKLKQWLKSKLIQFLGINDLVDLLDNHIDTNDRAIKNIKNIMYSLNNSTRIASEQDISHFQESVNVLHNTVENVVSIGTDVQPYGRSWAVICIEGKINIVKFVDLGRKEAMDIHDFLKHFEAGRHCIDSPYNEIFYNGLFKIQ